MNTDELSNYYGDFLDGSYNCVDRVVLNAYFGLCYSAGGFRSWWRRLYNGSEEELDNTHLMRMAGRFSRRVRGMLKLMVYLSSTAVAKNASIKSPKSI